MSKIKILESMIRRIVKEEQIQYSLSQLEHLVDTALEVDGAPDWFRSENPEKVRKAKNAEDKLIEIGYMNEHGEVDYPNTHPMRKIFKKLDKYMEDNYM